MRLQKLVETQVRNHLNIDEKQFDYLIHPSPSHLHDPFYYKDMRELVTSLHQFKKRQENDPSLLLFGDGDYDTDGVCSAIILNASLSVFGFNYRIYIPTMEDGYGLSETAIHKMMTDYCNEGERVGMILTADNGVKAFSGVSYAKSQGIDVLITDHHPSDGRLPDAKAVVDPLRKDDLYPFKGNSGATVIWKTMLAYANLFAKDKVEWIEKLIVFAGISNIADVMPMLGENRYMVVRAMDTIRELLKCTSYKDIMSTPYEAYNTAFYGLYDVITMLQKRKDDARIKEGKKPYSLPSNEELIAWYISPILNAPRRIHSTCFEALCAFTVADDNIRHMAVNRILELNDEKSEIVKNVIDALPETDIPNILCINAEKGICGLVAAVVREKTGKPSVVFAIPDKDVKDLIYKEIPKVETLSGSARSSGAYALNEIYIAMNRRHPGFVRGGGHAGAAGFTINGSDYARFIDLFNEVSEQVKEQIEETQEVILVPSNVITIVMSNQNITAEYEVQKGDEIITESVELDAATLYKDVDETISFIDRLRPFGKDFEDVKPTILLRFDGSVRDYYDWNPAFWKTFKFHLYDVECLTFDEEWANEVKANLSSGQVFTAHVELKMNEFRGNVTPQFLLTPVK